jgi:hypothetical protein
VKQYLSHARQMVRRATPKLLEHFAGPLLAIIILIPSLQIAPVGDDYRVIETAQPLSVSAIVRDLHLGSRGGPHYRPLEPIFLRFEYFLWKESSFGYHVTNALLHASCAWLTSRIAFTLSGSWLTAMIAGILVAVHPLAAPAVGHIAARNSLLACFFLLLCGWLFLKYQISKRPFLLAFSVAAFGMGLLSKEQAYVFPAVLLLLVLNRSGDAAGFATLRVKKVVIGSVLLFVVAALMIVKGGEFLVTLSAWEYGNYDLKLQVAQYGYVLGAVALVLLALAIAMPRYPNTAILVWYVVLEGLVLFFGMLPSGKLSEGGSYIQDSPFSFSYERLARDVFVLLTTLGIMDFDVRGALVQIGRDQPVIIAVVWLASGLLLGSMLVIQRRKMVALAALVWFLIALSPLRIRPVEFFETNNLYLAVPLVALACAALVKISLAWRTYVTIPIVITLVVFWASNLIDAQGKLITMGNFARELHSVLKGESKHSPGPLRVIVNAPDPFRSASEDRNLAHWIVFRIAQSAMQLGGYSDENVSFVEGKVVQVLAAEHGTACRYEAKVINSESIVVGKSSRQTDQNSCLSQLRLIDFVQQANNDQNSIVAYRKPQYSVRPLTQAELYVFDGNTLHRLAETKDSFKPSPM